MCLRKKNSTKKSYTKNFIAKIRLKSHTILYEEKLKLIVEKMYFEMSINFNRGFKKQKIVGFNHTSIYSQFHPFKILSTSTNLHRAYYQKNKKQNKTVSAY